MLFINVEVKIINIYPDSLLNFFYQLFILLWKEYL